MSSGRDVKTKRLCSGRCLASWSSLGALKRAEESSPLLVSELMRKLEGTQRNLAIGRLQVLMLRQSAYVAKGVTRHDFRYELRR